MKLSLFLLIKAIISLFFGILLAVIPTQMMAPYGITLDPTSVYFARIAGAVLIGIGLICLLNRNAPEPSLQDTILSLFVGDTIGFIAALMGQLGGVGNALGWINVLIWLLLALGLGYFRFIKSSA